MAESPEAVVSVGYLITAADYRSLCLTLMRRAVARAPVRSRCLHVGGLLLLVAGAVGATLLAHTPDHALVWGLCLVLGLLFSLYGTVVLPFATIRQADRTYARIGAAAGAQQMIFFPDRVRITSPQRTGSYPYALLHDVVETDTAFLVVIGAGDVRMLPKRVLDPQQIDRIRACVPQLRPVPPGS